MMNEEDASMVTTYTVDPATGKAVLIDPKTGKPFKPSKETEKLFGRIPNAGPGPEVPPIKFGELPPTTGQMNAKIISAAEPKSASDLVAKVRESISAGAGGLGLVQSVASLFNAGGVFSSPRFALNLDEGDVKKVVIRGPLSAKTSVSGGAAQINVDIEPKELWLDGKPADPGSLKMAKMGYDSYWSSINAAYVAGGRSNSKSFNGVVRATVSVTNGSVKVVIDGISAA